VVVGCSDPSEELPAPTGQICGFSDEIPRCEVTVAPPEDGRPNTLADAGTTVFLPAVRVGSGLDYEVAVGEGPVSAGGIPPGMSLADGVLRGVPTSVEAPTDYWFRIGENHITVTVYPSAVSDVEVQRYWDCGPYSTWSTSPERDCEQNPHIPEVGGIEDVDLFITYPARADPTSTGDGAVADGRWPVVLFAHANHDRVCDINDGYRSLHDHWASWGYVVVAVDATAWNCMRGSQQNIQARIDQVLVASQALEDINADPESRFFGRLDMERVVVAGHSRGGGAVLEVARLLPGVRAIIDLQGIDLTSFGFGADPVRGIPTLGMTAGNDVDLNYPIVEPTEDQLSGPYTWVNIDGGIHAYTADTSPVEPDDVPGITQQQQHDIDELFTTAFLARWIGVGDGSMPMEFLPDPGADKILFSHVGAQIVGELISGIGVHVRWNRRLNSVALPLDAEEVFTYTPDEEEPRDVWRKSVSYRLGPGEYEVSAGSVPVTVGDGATIQGRVKGPDTGSTATFDLKITTPAGTQTFLGSEISGPGPVYNRFSQLVAPVDGDEVLGVKLTVYDGVLFVDDLRIE
jgi:dienelactone hydrolase